MESKEQNYGVTGDHDSVEQGPKEYDPKEHGQAEDQKSEGVGSAEQGPAGHGPAVMGTREEKTWSVLAHLSTFLNVFTIFLGPVAALIIWLFYRDRSRKVAFDALQSAAYQGAWLAILGIGWAVTGLLTLILIGFLLIPPMALLTLVPLVHSAYAAYRVSQDGHYRYPIVADLIENR